MNVKDKFHLLVFAILFCVVSIILFSCTREKNIYRQIVNPEELKIRTIKNIDEFFPNAGKKNDKGHLVPKDGVGFIFFTPDSYTVTLSAPNCPLWFGTPSNKSSGDDSYAIFAGGTTYLEIDPSTNQLISKNFAICSKGFILLENAQKFRVKNHVYSLHNVDNITFGYFYIINSNGNILVGLTKHASSNQYKQKILLGSSSYIALDWREEDNRAVLTSGYAELSDGKMMRNYRYGYLKDNETIILRRDKNDKDEIEVNISSDSWKLIKSEDKQKPTYLAKVGARAITEEDFNRELSGIPAEKQQIFEGPKGAEKFLELIIQKEMMYQEAKKKGLDNAPENQKKVEDFKKTLKWDDKSYGENQKAFEFFKKLTVATSLIEKEIARKANVSNDEVRDFYEKNKAEFLVNRKPIEFYKIKDNLTERLRNEKQKQIYDSYIENLKKSYAININIEAITSLIPVQPLPPTRVIKR